VNVRVEIQLLQLPTDKDREQMYEAGELLTNDTDSILISQTSKIAYMLVAEFTITRPDK